LLIHLVGFNSLQKGFTVKKSKKDKSIITPNEIAIQARNESLPPSLDFGEANEADARDSGYTDSEGHAVSMAEKDVKGDPTGALTDIGAGRSSAILRRHPAQTQNKTIEDAPKLGEEQAP